MPLTYSINSLLNHPQTTATHLTYSNRQVKVSSLEFMIQVTVFYQAAASQPHTRVRSSLTPKMKTIETAYTGKTLLLTLKHSELMEWALKLHEKEGDYVLDCANAPPFTIYWSGSM